MFYAITLTWPKTLFTKKKFDFLNNSRLNFQKNASNQRNVKNCNETNPFYQWITPSFSEKEGYMQSH